MKRPIAKAMSALVAFAAGVLVGAIAFCERACPAPVRSGNDASADVRAALVSEKEQDSPVGVSETDPSEGKTSFTVEVVDDGVPAPEPEALAAHAERRARRRAAREAKVKERKDFLSELNLDLLDDGQRSTHALFLEALQVRESIGKEIADLRAAGREVPPELQSRLADAQSVLRADHDAEYLALREAALRAAGLDEATVRQLTDDLRSIDGLFDLSK